MRWRDERQSENIEDRRGLSGGKIAIGGLGGIVLLVIALLFGADPRQLLEQLPQQGSSPQTSRSTNPQDEEFSYETKEGARGFAAARMQNCQLLRSSGGDSQPFCTTDVPTPKCASKVSRKSDILCASPSTSAEPLSLGL